MAEKHKRPILNYCRYLLWDQDELEDAVQTVLSTAFQKYSDFEMGTDFRAWIYTVCTNVIRNINRKSNKEQQWFTNLEDTGDDILAELQREFAYDELLRHPEKVFAHIGDELHGALQSLSMAEQTVFLLKTIGDSTCKEISASLGMPIGTVMAYLSRARRKLRLHLCEYAKEYGFLKNEVRQEKTDEL